MKIDRYLTLAAIAIVTSTSSHAAVLAYEGFGNTANLVDINGYTPSVATSGTTGSWTRNGGSGAATQQMRPGGIHMVGITNGYTPSVDGSGNQGWVEQRNTWSLSRNTVNLSTSFNMTVDGTSYMSFFSRAGSVDHVAQLGLTDGTNELMWGRGYNSGLTAYYGPNGTSATTNTNNTAFNYTGYDTLFYVAEFVKTNSGTTNNLAVNIKGYNLTSSGTIASSAAAVTWDRTVSLTGVNNTFTALQFKIDGGGNYPSMDELRLGNTWTDVTGVVPEPSSAALLGLGALALAFRRRK